MGVGGGGGSSSCAAGSASVLAWVPSLLVTDPVLVSVVLHVPSLSLASLLKSDVEGWSGPLGVSFAAWIG